MGEYSIEDNYGRMTPEEIYTPAVTSTVTAPSFLDGLGWNSILGKTAPKYTGTADWAKQALGIDYDTADNATKLGLTDRYKALPNQEGLAGMLGGAKGFADLVGGLSTLGSMYMGYKQNKMAEKAHDAKMDEYKRQVNRDKAFAKNINASGLGTYSA